jgi:hypothetical protein
MATRWITVRAHASTAPATSSTARIEAGGASVTRSAKNMMSQAVDRCATKNSALRPRRSNSGCANANADSAVRWAPERSVWRTSMVLVAANYLPV